jgi:hypothetical protein
MLPLQVSRPSHHAAAAAAAAATASPASPDVGIGKTSEGATPKSKEQNMADMVRLRRGCGLLLLLLQAAVNLVTRHSRAGVQSDQQGGVHGMQLVTISMRTGHHCQAFANHFLPLPLLPLLLSSPCLYFGTYDYLRHWPACLATAFRLRYLFYSSFNKLINLFPSIFCKVISAPICFGLPSALL